MGQFISPEDLEPFADIEPAKAKAMIEDAEAMAILTAPCLADLPENSPKRGSVKAVARTAILRWNDAGTGALQQVSAGPFQQSAQPQARRAMFYPSEIEHLRNLCKKDGGGKAFAIDTVPTSSAGHSVICSLMLGGIRCSCGADMAGEPIYGDA